MNTAFSSSRRRREKRLTINLNMYGYIRLKLWIQWHNMRSHLSLMISHSYQFMLPIWSIPRIYNCMTLSGRHGSELKTGILCTWRLGDNGRSTPPTALYRSNPTSLWRISSRPGANAHGPDPCIDGEACPAAKRETAEDHAMALKFCAWGPSIKPVVSHGTDAYIDVKSEHRDNGRAQIRRLGERFSPVEKQLKSLLYVKRVIRQSEYPSEDA